MFFPTTFATFTLLLPLTTAHQTLQQLWINNATPGPQIGIRTPPNNSPVKDLTSPSLICNVGGTKTPSGVKTLPAPAGAKIKVQWSPLVHMGPITHMLYGPVDDASQTSGEGAGWFKIDELDSVGGKWASQVMIGENYTHEFSLPEGLASGEYLLRSEMVALHNAQLVGGAEFYVGCAQLKVEGGKASGKSEKRGKGEACGPTISLPGAYKAEDKSVYIPDVYSGFEVGSYKAPGGPVAVCGGGSGGGSGGDGIPASGSPASNSTVAPSGSPTLPSASTIAPTGFATLVRPSPGVAAPTGTVPKASVGTAKIWEKCGGQGFTGPTTCEGSAKCVKQNEWYSQCVQ
ncbi:Carbohydrate-binding module family 1 protein [Pyrenophora tritici-repentis]|uniref:AA9 family lytic polysaccharide monooxygenase n=1 Tax=Pyrenophora tritici-repentis TaxID=45151 RepID=A0A922SUV6_9PLEO|nr:Carbohydrate-binding module family 1 protein [Pyrenophora tritici-repentis]KAI1663917.1 Carbohydrate-binding module family 1 protein [Pyrenophora tritici-repentis]KAI1683149.1 Carbohydrate-binding module family 1 protein [Pyrenophora tritici-repentis]